ncbi:SRPBCC family protein [Streptomyces uncialis]|uniref:SRPBCC family protein n=1 Tax=Streptomyces uncialis TaxID=1048205 RepID=UPI002E3822D5|nr:SRPBCC family protein [Streptomyces uncialis]WST72444.1 SRPBCC family protein [Streptomyces uncialis]
MAVRHQLIRRPPAEVWAVLADGSRYGEWVVGPDSSRQTDGDWPRTGATLEYTIRLGPWSGTGRTVVRDVEPPRRIELEAESGRLGTARIAIEVRPWGEKSLVIVDEHPLRGPGGRLHNTALDSLLQLRNRKMLSRLADVVESTSPRSAERT